jgi:hypothetical protein
LEGGRGADIVIAVVKQRSEMKPTFRPPGVLGDALSIQRERLVQTIVFESGSRVPSDVLGGEPTYPK